MTQTMTGRWVRLNDTRSYPWAQCRYCGRAQQHDCAPVVCPACDSRQCHGHGGGNGGCVVCHHGWLPGWSRIGMETTCGYSRCDEPAVANAPRVKRVCAKHLERAHGNYIAERVAHRDSGKGWENFRWLD